MTSLAGIDLMNPAATGLIQDAGTGSSIPAPIANARICTAPAIPTSKQFEDEAAANVASDKFGIFFVFTLET
jgi:hypothetical protein